MIILVFSFSHAIRPDGGSKTIASELTVSTARHPPPPCAAQNQMKLLFPVFPDMNRNITAMLLAPLFCLLNLVSVSPQLSLCVS